MSLTISQKLAVTPTPDLSHADREVLHVMAGKADFYTGENARPSIKTIAGIAGYSSREVQRSRKRLIDAGYLVKTGTYKEGGRADREVAVFRVVIDPNGVAVTSPRDNGRGDVHDTYGATCRSPNLNPLPIKTAFKNRKAGEPNWERILGYDKDEPQPPSFDEDVWWDEQTASTKGN
jgi:hypothetical protein